MSDKEFMSTPEIFPRESNKRLAAYNDCVSIWEYDLREKIKEFYLLVIAKLLIYKSEFWLSAS